MSRVLGDLPEEGVVIKLAYDLYCGGNTPRELASNLSRLLATLDSCNLKIAPPKTVKAPSSMSSLGNKELCVLVHTLTTREPPTKGKGLRSFIGAFKVLTRVVSGYSAFFREIRRTQCHGTMISYMPLNLQRDPLLTRRIFIYLA